MHYFTSVCFFSNSVRRVKMPDVVVLVKIKCGGWDCQQSQQTPPTSLRKMDAIPLLFQITQEPMDAIKRPIRMHIISNIINRLSIEFKHLRAKMDFLLRQRMGIDGTTKLDVETQQGLIEL